MASGIRDKVAILGMGCSEFGERWDCGAEELMVEAFGEAVGVDASQIDAAWFSTHYEEINVGKGGLPLSIALRLPNIAVTRVENFCASGSEAFRGAVYAVASGACDIALALGVEKLKDTGYGGLPGGLGGTLNPQWAANGSAPGNFAQLASAYRAKHGVGRDDLKRAIAHISVKSHANGARNPKAHLKKPITEEQALNAPMIAEPLGLFDCCGVSDGAACAILTTPEIARQMGKEDIVTVKALQLALSNGSEAGHNSWDGSYFHTTRIAANKAYQEAGIDTPREQVYSVVLRAFANSLTPPASRITSSTVMPWRNANELGEVTAPVTRTLDRYSPAPMSVTVTVTIGSRTYSPSSFAMMSATSSGVLPPTSMSPAIWTVILPSGRTGTEVARSGFRYTSISSVSPKPIRYSSANSGRTSLSTVGGSLCPAQPARKISAAETMAANSPVGVRMRIVPLDQRVMHHTQK